MPELPEVETVRAGLAPHITSANIVKVSVHNHHFRWPIPENLSKYCQGKSIQKVKRRSKYLLLELNHNEHLLIHLGMSGVLRYYPQMPTPKKHDHVIITLNNGVIIFNDPRRFGCMLYHEGSIDHHPLLAKIGPEPTDPSLKEDYLYSQLKQSKRCIKSALMDGNILPGIGNIYANEALFAAEIHPQTLCCKLSKSQIIRLQDHSVAIIKEAIEQGGTTLKDFISADGKPGYFQQVLKVYGRENLPCEKCPHTIEMVRIASRASFYCPNCQPQIT